MDFESLSQELKERARACKTMDELIAFAEEEGFELTNEALESIAGGICKRDCPWLGAVCINDTDCKTDTGCPGLFSCPQLSQCKDLFGCQIVEAPLPTPEPNE